MSREECLLKTSWWPVGCCWLIPLEPSLFGYLIEEPALHLGGLENEMCGFDDWSLVITVPGKSATCDLSLLFLVEMWYGVFLWALVSSLFFHVPAGLLALFTLRHHKYGRFMSVSILLMGIVGPITAGILTSMLDIKIPVTAFHMTRHLLSGSTLETCLSEVKKKKSDF